LIPTEPGSNAKKIPAGAVQRPRRPGQLVPRIPHPRGTRTRRTAGPCQRHRRRPWRVRGASKPQTGTPISVQRADGSTATFIVDRGATYKKNDFATLEVYGNTPGAELRLITCDGYNPGTGLFDDNYVIYAKLKA
jgi:hypothetical protein